MAERPDITIVKAADVAELLKVHVNRVYEMAQSGDIPQLRRLGPELRFDRDAIIEWMRAGHVDTSAGAGSRSGSGVAVGVDTGLDTSRTPRRRRSARKGA